MRGTGSIADFALVPVLDQPQPQLSFSNYTLDSDNAAASYLCGLFDTQLTPML